MKSTVAAAILLVSLARHGSALAPSVRLSVTDGGAVGDGVTLNTTAIQKTIDQVASQGGGTVVVPQGVFLSGAVFLKPGVNLQIDKGAVLKGSTNIADYPSMETRIEGHTQIWRPALVNAKNADHLRITGSGMILGGGKPFWTAFFQRRAADRATKNLDVDRPRNIFIQDSNDVVLSGVSLQDSGFWNLHLYRCRNVVVENLSINAPAGAPSSDGMDIDSCQDVEVRGCHISVDDDDICLKGSKGPMAASDKDSPPVERIHVHDCTFDRGGGVLTLGSEATVVRNIVVDHCLVEGPGTRQITLLRLKLRTDTPQHYENIQVHDIKLNGSGKFVSMEPWTQYFDLKGQPAPAQVVDNVTISNVTGTFGRFGAIAGPALSTIKNVTLENIDIQLTNPTTRITNVKNLKLTNVKINGQAITQP